MPAPKKGKRFGGSAAHQKLILANLASHLLISEAGAIVTDAYGHSLADHPLLGSSHEFQMSCVTAANAELHAAICSELDAGIERLRACFS